MRTYCLALVVLVVGGMSYADQETADRLSIIVEKAAEREKALSAFDSTFTWRYFEPAAEKPGIIVSGRWVKDGDKFRVDMEDRDVRKPGFERIWHHFAGYNGREQRIYHKEDQSGNVFADVDQYVKKNWMYCPRSLGADHACTPLSKLMEGGAGTIPSRNGEISYTQKSTLIGKERVGEYDCDIVESVVDLDGRKAQVERLYFCGQFGYCPVRIEMLYPSDTGELAVHGRWTFGDIKEIKPGVWYPTFSRHEIYQGKPEIQGTETMEVAIAFPEVIDQALFSPEFPMGTQVLDQITGVSYVVGGKMRLPGDMDIESGILEPAKDTKSEQSQEIVSDTAEISAESRQPESVVQQAAPSADGNSSRRGILWTLAAVALFLIAAVVLACILLRRRRA